MIRTLFPMQGILLTTAALVTVPALAAQAPPPSAACQVWQRELAFAHTVETHDAKAFASYLAPHAIFAANTPRPVRGSSLILQRWATILSGTLGKLSWYPTQVVTAEGGTLAYSSGPFLLERTGKDGQLQRTVGHFATVWRRGPDGTWRVAFDGGEEGHAASDQEVSAFRAGRSDACPATLDR